ncbi:hypothetical protein E2C01_021369 [Portunus trituberculatus]|uniref:Uncharacterized protein n=1 Tax=Portunus trituberculatus TaxID=210409 RepID=A0A5B7E477_PORTR|nr:hypothetical protein [Portunus trituberculatus]
MCFHETAGLVILLQGLVVVIHRTLGKLRRLHVVLTHHGFRHDTPVPVLTVTVLLWKKSFYRNAKFGPFRIPHQPNPKLT